MRGVTRQGKDAKTNICGGGIDIHRFILWMVKSNGCIS